jgi:hypothetical protein
MAGRCDGREPVGAKLQGFEAGHRDDADIGGAVGHRRDDLVAEPAPPACGFRSGAVLASPPRRRGGAHRRLTIVRCFARRCAGGGARQLAAAGKGIGGPAVAVRSMIRYPAPLLLKT